MSPNEAQHVTRAAANSRELLRHLAALRDTSNKLPSTSYKDACRNRENKHLSIIWSYPHLWIFSRKTYSVFHSYLPHFNWECFRFRLEAFHKKAAQVRVCSRHLHLQLRDCRWGSLTNNCLFGFVTSQKQNTYLETSRKPRLAEDFTCPLLAPQPSSVPAATWSSHRGTLFWAHLRMTTASENSIWSQKQICS